MANEITKNSNILSNGVSSIQQQNVMRIISASDTLKPAYMGGIGTPPFIEEGTTYGVSLGGGATTIQDILGGGVLGDTLSTAASGDMFKVRLVSVLGITQGTPSKDHQVVFDVTPTLTESGSVEYSQVVPVHMPGGIQVYKNTQSRSFDIGAHFISRNTTDAMTNIKNLQRLRAWRYPYFGSSSTVVSSGTQSEYVSNIVEDNSIRRIQDSGVELLGAPPEVLYLYAYSSPASSNRNETSGINLNRIPVVITNLSIIYPDDVDYIPIDVNGNGQSEPFPVKMDVQISLAETHSPVEFEKFSLMDYKNGKLTNW